MNGKTPSQWIRLIAALTILSLWINLLPPPLPVSALAPSLPDYSAQLLATSGTLERDDRGALRFPYPAIVEKEAASSSAQRWSRPMGFGWLTHWFSAFDWASPAPRLAAQGPNAPVQGQPGAVQNAHLSPPHVINPSPAKAPLGATALFAALLPDPTILAAELGFTNAHIEQIQAIIETEGAAMAALDAQANLIINNKQGSRQAKGAALAASDYNGRLRTILRTSQDELQKRLGAPRYEQLVSWFNEAWQAVIAQRTTTRAAAATEPCPTFTVFATRSFHTDYSADLPDQYIKFANQGIEYSHGYTNTTIYSVSVQLNNQIIHNVVITDAGPHNEDDNYWNRADDPLHPRRLFSDLPQGTPEAEAAYFDNYNNGRDQFGRIVTNPAGINLSTQAAEALGMVGNQWVTVTFPWDCTPAPPASPPLERSWGANDWSKSAATLVNPVTGNQALWARDLYVSAPGLPVDFVRYYNSRDDADGIFGRGWSSELDMRVYPQDNGTYKVRYGDGERALFRPDGDGFVGEAGVFDSFAHAGDGFVLTLADEQISYRFDGNGRLLSINDRTDNQITLAYTDGNPTTITDSAGRAFTLTFDGNGHVTRMEDPLGRVVTYAYEAPRIASVNPEVATLAQSSGDMLTSVTDPNQGTTTYEYDPATQALNKAVDGDGIPFVENLYDEQGRVREQRNADGKTGKMEYDAQNRRSTFTDNLGNQTVYVYDRKMRVMEEIDALGNSISYTYNDLDQLTAKTDKRGHTWKYAYDERGNVIRREDPIDDHSAEHYSADVTTWVYNDHNLPTQMTTGRGEVTRYEYDERGNLTRVIAPNGATTTSLFNNKGQMTRLTDAEGRVTRYGYDERGNRNEIIDANGGVTRFIYDNAGRVVSETDAENHTTRYEYDGNGNITKITDPLGHITRREYNRNNLVTKEIDRRGATYTYRYDKELNLVEETDPLGHGVRYEYDAMHNRTRLIDANGNSTAYTYDKLYRITSITEPLGGTTHYSYDENGNVLSTTDALGQTTRYTYDALNRRIFVVDALGNKTELIYDQLDRVTQTVDAYGAVSRYRYDSAGNLVEIINPLNAVTTYGYDLVHNRTRTTDPNGHTRIVAYDRLSRAVAYTDALSQVNRLAYDRIGNTTAITDANGNVSTTAAAKGGETTFIYDANSQLVRATDALNAQTSYTYDEEGNRLSETDANGHTVSTVYDLRGNMTAVTDALGNTTRFTYDANGNQISQTDANGYVTRYEYGASDLLVRAINARHHPVVYEYDLLGRMIRTTDANGKASVYEYDALDRVVGVVDAKGQETRYSYDAVGNLTSLTDANRSTTRFAYNALNQVIQETNALGHSWRYSYDGVGNLVEKIDGRDQAIRYDYDAADRLLRKGFPDGKAVTYQYDANDNRLQMADWNGITTETYDAIDQPTVVTDHKGRRLAYSYDGKGNRVTMLYPDQRLVRYHYDARDLLIGMDDPDNRAMRYAYDAGGRLTSYTRPNQTRTDFTYDGADRLTSVHTTGSSGSIIGNFDYTLDPVGNRTGVVATRSDGAPVTYSYSYDDLYQLVSAGSDSGATLTYAYDEVGNRLNVQGAPEPLPSLPTAPISTTYQYNEINAMLHAGNAVLSYDDNGNRVRSEQPLADTKYAELGLYGTLRTDYTFDIEDRLVAVGETIYYGKTDPASDPGAVVMEAAYSYDGDGRRIAKLVQTYNLQGGRLDVLLREYLYDGLDVATEYEYHNGATTPDITHYYYANGEKVTLERISAHGEKQVYWYAYDALGSTTALLDAVGQVTAEYQSDEFGRLLTGNSPLNHYLFTGQEYDPETGLYHFFARYYDPATGVWLSQDVQRGTAMDPGAWHRYAYVLNSPINRVDILGYGWLDDLGDLANDYVVEPVKDAAEAVKEGAKDAAEAVDRYVVKPVVKAYDTVKEEVGRRYEQAKRWVKQRARDVNDNIIQPTRRAVVSAAKTVREGVTKAADWVQEHKDTIAMVAGTVGAIAAGAAFCGATAGIGCLVIAGVGGGAIAAGGVQMGANLLDSSADTGVLDNVGRAAIFGGVTGGLDGLTGGLASKAFAAARPLVQRGATALGQRLASAARGVGAAAPRLGNAARNVATAARGVGAAAQRASMGLRNAVGRGAACSFSAATPVLTEHGAQPISTIEIGDRVRAYHEVLGETGSFTVTAVISHTDAIIAYVTIDGEQLETTPEHPFYTHERGWVAADELWVGAQVYRAGTKGYSHTGTVQEITRVERRQPMYNLAVAQAHTFFVGTEQWLVHNGGCDLAYLADATLKALPENLRQATVAVAGNRGGYTYAVRVGGPDYAPLTQEAATFLRNRGLKVVNPGKNPSHAEQQLIDAGHLEIGISRQLGLCKACKVTVKNTPGVSVTPYLGRTVRGPAH